MLFSLNDREDDTENQYAGPSLDNYLEMDDKQKDAETQKAVLRLQKRIQEIFYLLDAQKNPASLSDRERKP